MGKLDVSCKNEKPGGHMLLLYACGFLVRVEDVMIWSMGSEFTMGWKGACCFYCILVYGHCWIIIMSEEHHHVYSRYSIWIILSSHGS